MSKFIFLFLSLLLPVKFIQAETKILDRFHVCTVATYYHENLYKLLQSCAKHGINLEIIGMGKPYPGNGVKLVYVREYLNTLDDRDIVLFVDAFDVLFVADKLTILEKFQSMQVPFVMAAEKNAWPPHFRDLYPECKTPWRYINTGTYIGYVKNIKEWIDDLKPTNESDQTQATAYYFSKPDKRHFVLDHYCNLFLPLCQVWDNEVQIDLINKRVRCSTTQSYPCIVHANGNNFDIWHKVYKELTYK